MPSVDYKKHLLESLRDPAYAAGYLNAAFDEGGDIFLLALRDVAQARGGVKALADATKLNRENLYDILSRKGNPRFSSIVSVLRELGFELSFKPATHRPRAA